MRLTTDTGKGRCRSAVVTRAVVGGDSTPNSAAVGGSTKILKLVSGHIGVNL